MNDHHDKIKRKLERTTARYKKNTTKPPRWKVDSDTLKRHNKFVANINAVREHVDAAKIEMLFEKFTNDAVFTET